MCKINKGLVEQADKWLIGCKNWGFDAYDNTVYAQISYDVEGFCVKFTIKESNPLRNMTKHFDLVDKDSCVEFFVNFMPEQTEAYFNLEVNALGKMNASFGLPGNGRTRLKLEEVESFDITSMIGENEWTVHYKIGYDFIRNYYPEFDIRNCKYVKGNLYKCASWSDTPHYLSYFKVDSAEKNFHNPKFYGKFVLE